MDLGLAGSLIAFRKGRFMKFPTTVVSSSLLPVRLRLDIFLNQNHRAIIDMSAMRPIVTQRKDEHSIINLMGQLKVSAVTGV